MSTPGPSEGSRTPAAGWSAAQTRVLTAALELFATHGVSGTSLQMIASAIGVTKAAVYHQFRTKEEIVLAVAELGLAELVEAVEAAEAEPRRDRARDVLLAKVVDTAVRRRRETSVLRSDPVMVRFLGSHPPFQHLIERIYRLLIGEVAPEQETRVRVAMLSAALGGGVSHPLVAGIDDETLTALLLQVTRGILGVEAAGAAAAEAADDVDGQETSATLY
ncbi:TetR/AcrR family transcriptional regulator [Frankia sp. R43]|uniref:TetR/AcrR family transcriptional regulator n=1 Tax=Frankia sp. R43 TaxID=269536 RepID=UPI001F3474C9|nr:TetR/AcrR family transcriptional regulator [Frankia sp. R43]